MSKAKQHGKIDRTETAAGGSEAAAGSPRNGFGKVLFTKRLMVMEGLFLAGALLIFLGLINIQPGFTLPVSGLLNSTNIFVDLGTGVMMFAGIFLFKSAVGRIRDLSWGKAFPVVGMILMIISVFLYFIFSALWMLILTVLVGTFGLEGYTITSFIFTLLKVLAILSYFLGIFLYTLALRRSRSLDRAAAKMKDAENEAGNRAGEGKSGSAGKGKSGSAGKGAMDGKGDGAPSVPTPVEISGVSASSPDVPVEVSA